jgi:hypothetical protein
MDPSLLRQVFTKSVADGVEANPERTVRFLIHVSAMRRLRASPFQTMTCRFRQGSLLSTRADAA